MKLAFELQEIANDAKAINQKLCVLQDLHIDETLELKLFFLEIQEQETNELLDDIDLAEAYLEILNNSLRELKAEVAKTWELLNAKIDYIDNF